MTDFDEMHKHPNYDAAATAHSKYGIFLFFITFFCMQFFTDGSSGFLGGGIFLAVGMFVVSIGLMFPTMVIRAKFNLHGGMGCIMSIVETALVIYCTRWAFIKLFG